MPLHEEIICQCGGDKFTLIPKIRSGGQIVNNCVRCLHKFEPKDHINSSYIYGCQSLPLCAECFDAEKKEIVKDNTNIFPKYAEIYWNTHQLLNCEKRAP